VRALTIVASNTDTPRPYTAGGLCRPEEIASMALFPGPDAFTDITGQVWAVDGGMDRWV
jgi:NAD(P)-dependent dehydrogenase (short-subunit alcohol dehydrogenase family)